jgi:membrane protease YdiL (CAAX protease family)
LEAVDFNWKNARVDIILGLLIGLVFFVTGAFAHYVKDQSFLPSTDKISTPLTILYFISISLASSFSEEILSRGFILKRLYEESKNMFTSTFFASFLFFFLHIPILFTDSRINGGTLLQIMFTDIVLSLAVSFIYLQRKNVILPILIHAFYNLSIYFFVA